jgi:hypothetical protein
MPDLKTRGEGQSYGQNQMSNVLCKVGIGSSRQDSIARDFIAEHKWRENTRLISNVANLTLGLLAESRLRGSDGRVVGFAYLNGGGAREER